jgi:hypothetical protein
MFFVFIYECYTFNYTDISIIEKKKINVAVIYKKDCELMLHYYYNNTAKYILLLLLIKHEIELSAIYLGDINGNLISPNKLRIKKYKQRRVIKKHYSNIEKIKYLIERFYSGYVYGYEAGSFDYLITKENCIAYLGEKNKIVYNQNCIIINKELEDKLKEYKKINGLLKEQYIKKWKI